MLNYRRRNTWSSRRPRSSYSSYQRRKPFPWRLAILGGIPAGLLVLELLLRLISGLTGNATMNNYQGEAPNVSGYRLQFTNAQGKPYQGLQQRGELSAQYNALMGYTLLPDQKNGFWQINGDGFRYNQPIPTAKPADEVRIFVIGGSAAFGQLSTNNQATFAARLEARLNKQVADQRTNPGKFRPDVLPYFADEVARVMNLPPRIRGGRYRVINAAVPGYSSGNEMMQLTLKILPYKPDMIIVMNGYPDLILPSTEPATEVPGIEEVLQDSTRHFTQTWTQPIGNFFQSIYLIRGFQQWVMRSSETPSFVIPPVINQPGDLTGTLKMDQAELGRRTNRYRGNLQMMARFANTARVPMILALQPEITSRKPGVLTPQEKYVLDQLGSEYPKQMKEGYNSLLQSIREVKRTLPDTVTTLNYYDLLANFKGQAFQDPVHLTDAANTQVANTLYGILAERLTVKSQPFSGTAPASR
jgi:hypothetical protein